MGGSATDAFGISCGSINISTSTFTGNEVTDAVISYNKNRQYKISRYFISFGIYVVTSSNTGTNLISNNTLTNLGTNGTCVNSGSGIFVMAEPQIFISTVLVCRAHFPAEHNLLFLWQ